jgi:hypothetical protein
MLPLYLEILLKLKIAERFGKVSVIEKNGINTIPFKNILIYTKNHHNNLIGKVECNDNKSMFYYIPLNTIDNYELKNSGMEIYSQISVCPFCFGIYLDTEEQYKYYKMMRQKEEKDTNLDTNLDTTITDELYTLLKEYFCFDFIKNAKEPRFPRAPSFTKEK